MKTPVSAYFEQQIQAADPVTLIGIYYQCVIKEITDARQYLATGDIIKRSRSISLAHALFAELYRSLDFKAGDGKISKELGRLYDFAMRRLIAANAEQKDQPLAEAYQVAATLADAWRAVPKPAEAAVSLSSAPVRAGQWGEPSEAATSQYSWSL